MSSLDDLKTAIDQAFTAYVRHSPTSSSITGSEAGGKVYEVFALGKVAERLTCREGMRLEFVQGQGGGALAMKAGGGPINRNFPHLRVEKNGSTVAELWTDVEFQTLSCIARGNTSPSCLSHTHELDVVMVDSKTKGYPQPKQIWLAVECKNTAFRKEQLRALLGIRRELSLLQEKERTQFDNWPDRYVPASPPSSLIFFSVDPRVHRYTEGPGFFGVHLEHLVP